MNLDQIIKEAQEEFRKKWGRFYYSDTAGMDWEKPDQPNFEANEEDKILGSDGKCLASDDIEKDLATAIRKAYERGKQEFVDKNEEDIKFAYERGRSDEAIAHSKEDLNAYEEGRREGAQEMLEKMTVPEGALYHDDITR